MSLWLIQKSIYLILLGAIIIYGVAGRAFLDMAYRYIVLLVSATLIFEYWAILLAKDRIPNGHVYILFSPIQTFLTACIYAQLITSRRLRIIGMIACILIVELWVWDLLTFDYKKSNINITSRSVLFVLFALLLFQEWVENPKSKLSFGSPILWFNMAILFFYLINILFWSVYNTPIQQQYIINKIFNFIRNYSNFIFYSIIWFSLIKAYIQKRKDTIT